MRDFRRALQGIGAGVRSKMVRLRDRQKIQEIEALFERPGGSWTTDFQSKCDTASLALFGVTEADTRPREPHPDSFETDSGPLSRFMFSAEAHRAYDAALTA